MASVLRVPPSRLLACGAILGLLACDDAAPSSSAAHQASLQSAAAGAPAASAPPSPDRQRAPGQDPCKVVCERSQALGCVKTAECAQTCAASRDIEVCTREMAAVLECITAHPIERWECGEEGLASIKSGYCDPEQATFMSCLGRKVP
jgi:hypothetical protein